MTFKKNYKKRKFCQGRQLHSRRQRDVNSSQNVFLETTLGVKLSTSAFTTRRWSAGLGLTQGISFNRQHFLELICGGFPWGTLVSSSASSVRGFRQ